MLLEEKVKSILILCPYPLGKAPGQRFRFEHYLELLSEKNVKVKIEPFLDKQTDDILYLSGHYVQKIFGVLTGFFKRFLLLFRLKSYDYIYVFREMTPVGPPIFEWLLGKVFRKRLIYDFDDAIWQTNTSKNNKIISKFKWHTKVASICKWSHKITVGNSYLADFVKQHNSNVEIIPTVVNTDKQHNKVVNQRGHQINLGWTGSHSTLKYIDLVLPVLRQLEEKFDFNFYVIADKNPNLPLKSFKFIPWNKSSEIEDLLKFQVGIMPLYNEEWAKGKCSFKGIQYMALGISPVLSAIGMNNELIEHGKNGFLCSNNDEWKAALTTLLTNPTLRERIGKEARKEIVNHYSVVATEKQFLNLFDLT